MKISNTCLLIFVTFSFAKADLRIQHGFTRTQLEREVNEQTVPVVSPTTYVIAGGSKSCLETACQMSGTFGCDESSEVIGLAKACRGNSDDQCLRQICATLGSFGCDEYSEVKAVATNCGSNESQTSIAPHAQYSNAPRKPYGF
jgi:hypothetical protein